LKPWEDAISTYVKAGLKDDDPKLFCTKGNIEISKRFVSPAPTDDAIRSVLHY
jgi:hypothetical protein